MKTLVSVMLLGGSALVFAGGLWADSSMYMGLGLISCVLAWFFVLLVVWRN